MKEISPILDPGLTGPWGKFANLYTIMSHSWCPPSPNQDAKSSLFYHGRADKHQVGEAMCGARR